MVNLSYAPTKGKINESTTNGIDNLPKMTTSQKEIKFVKSYTDDSNNPPPDSEPGKEIKIKYPFGSFGFSFGLRIGI